MSAQVWRYPSDSRGSMVTKVNHPTPGHGECWMFWYHMDGSNVGFLNIYVQELRSARSHTLVWSMSGDQGEQWRHGRVSIINPHSPYKVIMKYSTIKCIAVLHKIHNIIDHTNNIHLR